MFMTHQQSSELAQPRVGAFDDPTPLVAAQFASIFVPPGLAILPVRRDQLDATFLQALAQRVRIVGCIRNHSFRLLPRTPFGLRNRDLLERGFRKPNFVRRGTFQPIPAEDLDRRPVPSTSSPCPAWFCRRQSPFFRRSKTAVEKSLVPPQQTSFIQRSQQRAPCIQPHAFVFPLLEPTPAGRGRGKL